MSNDDLHNAFTGRSFNWNLTSCDFNKYIEKSDIKLCENQKEVLANTNKLESLIAIVLLQLSSCYSSRQLGQFYEDVINAMCDFGFDKSQAQKYIYKNFTIKSIINHIITNDDKNKRIILFQLSEFNKVVERDNGKLFMREILDIIYLFNANQDKYLLMPCLDGLVKSDIEDSFNSSQLYANYIHLQNVNPGV
jgi:hypothetical protein